MKKSIKRRGDHSEYDHPDDIWLSLNKPGIARTHKPLNIFEPRYLDMVNDSMKSNKMIGMIQPKKTGNLKKPDLFPDGGYISTIPLDPWGNSYIYEYPSRKGLKYDIYTLGADGMPGGDGENLDIGNWTK